MWTELWGALRAEGLRDECAGTLDGAVQPLQQAVSLSRFAQRSTTVAALRG